MVSRSRTKADKKTPPASRTEAAPATPPMKVTVDEVALRTLYERMLRAHVAHDGARNGSAPANEALAAATIDLHEGDAVAQREYEPLHLGPALQLLPLHLGLAAGVALAYRFQGEHRVVLSLAHASTLDLGSAHEALTYASSQKLPLIVVVDCGQAASPDALDARAAAYGIPSISVDGKDAVAIYRVSREAIDRARAGRGPTLIHCLTFDPDANPITRLEHYLAKHGWWSAAWKRQILSNGSRDQR